MASNCGHLPVDCGSGWIAFIVEKNEEPMRVEQTRFDRQAGTAAMGQKQARIVSQIDLLIGLFCFAEGKTEEALTIPNQPGGSDRVWRVSSLLDNHSFQRFFRDA
jgi:hypothetical protein